MASSSLALFVADYDREAWVDSGGVERTAHVQLQVLPADKAAHVASFQELHPPHVRDI